MNFKELMEERGIIAQKRIELEKKMWPYCDKNFLSCEEQKVLDDFFEKYKEINKEDSLLVEKMIEVCQKN